MLIESIRTKLLPYDHDQFTQNVISLRAHRDDPILNGAWAAGRALTLEQAIALALGDG